jgi:hypothetical protein
VSRNTHRARARLRELADELAIGAAMRLRTDADEIRPVIDAVVASGGRYRRVADATARGCRSVELL